MGLEFRVEAFSGPEEVRHRKTTGTQRSQKRTPFKAIINKHIFWVVPYYDYSTI